MAEITKVDFGTPTERQRAKLADSLEAIAKHIRAGELEFEPRGFVLRVNFNSRLKEIQSMKTINAVMIFALLTGCAFVPVQDQTLKNATGGEITCKQVGAGLISSSVGKSRFDECVANAKAAGYQ